MAKQNKRFDGCLEMYRDGASVGDIAKHFGNSRQSMWDVLRRRGCSFRSNLRFGNKNHFWRDSSDDDRAQNMIEKAILYGRIVPPDSCEKCGANYRFSDGRRAIQAHHCDYNKPLDVMWLCQKCHHEWHKINKAVKRTA